MAKFNVGDIIKCIDAGYSYITIGQTYEVKALDYDGDPKIIDKEGDLSVYNSGVFELVKAATPVIKSVDDLETGMRVVTANGREAIFVAGEGQHHIVYSADSAWDHAYIDADTRHRIVEVYAAPSHAAHYLNVSKRGVLLWREVDAAKVAAVEKAKAKLAEARAELAAAEAALK